MFADFDYDVILRSLPYMFYDGMTFTLTLTVLATIGGIVFGTLLALMQLSGIAPREVKRIEVLKDAASIAEFASVGTAGVVVVTTWRH